MNVNIKGRNCLTPRLRAALNSTKGNTAVTIGEAIHVERESIFLQCTSSKSRSSADSDIIVLAINLIVMNELD